MMEQPVEYKETAWFERYQELGGYGWGAAVRNASELPILDVRVFFYWVNDPGGGSPWSVFERRFCGGNGAIHVVRVRIGDLGNDFFRRGVVDRKGLRRLAGDPLGLHFGLNSTWHGNLRIFALPRIISWASTRWTAEAVVPTWFLLPRPTRPVRRAASSDGHTRRRKRLPAEEMPT